MNDKKNNSATKYLVVGIVALVLLLVLVRAGGDSSEKNSAQVNTTSNSSTENTEEESIDSVEVPAVPETDKPDEEVPFGGSIYSDAGVPDVGEEEGYGGSDEEIDITKFLIPVDEMYKTGMYGEDKTEGLQSYCKIISLMPLEFALGNIEGCPNGWSSSEKGPKECLISDNWRETQKFTSTKEDSGVYYGTLTKDDSEDYQTTEFRCIVDTEDIEIRCGYYGIINDPEGKVFKILVNKDLSVIEPSISIK